LRLAYFVARFGLFCKERQVVEYSLAFSFVLAIELLAMLDRWKHFWMRLDFLNRAVLLGNFSNWFFWRKFMGVVQGIAIILWVSILECRI
jgi:hypothetical protein